MKENIILKLIEMLVANDSTDSSTDDKECSIAGQSVIVRCRDAGVHFGTLINYSGRVVELKDSRRMWRWHAASENTLSGVARHGINKSKSKIQGTLDYIVLQDACEIIPIRGTPEKSILEAEVYNEQ